MGGGSSKEVEIYRENQDRQERIYRENQEVMERAMKMGAEQLSRLNDELRRKDRTIERKDETIERGMVVLLELQRKGEGQRSEIRELRSQLEELLDEKLLLKENELDNFIQQLGIERERVRELRIAYRSLIRARGNNNRNEIDEASDRIEVIKDQILSGGWFTWRISVNDTQELCRKCEEIVTLRENRENIREQQYQARQEVPINRSLRL